MSAESMKTIQDEWECELLQKNMQAAQRDLVAARKDVEQCNEQIRRTVQRYEAIIRREKFKSRRKPLKLPCVLEAVCILISVLVEICVSLELVAFMFGHLVAIIAMLFAMFFFGIIWERADRNGAFKPNTSK